MAIEIKVPSVGESITEVTLVKWIKKAGDWVERDEVIAELESEKATFEINAEQAGILNTIAGEGDTLKIGDLACSIDTEAARPAGKVEEVQMIKTAPAETATTPSTAAPKAVPADDVKATPVAAAIIADKKIDVKSVTPSGSNGRIVKQDVLEAINNPGRLPGLTLFGRNETTQK